jgi:hypothetical protein
VAYPRNFVRAVGPDRAATLCVEEPMCDSNLLQQDATAWLLAIGQRLRIEYEDLAEPMPPRLTALLKL